MTDVQHFDQRHYNILNDAVIVMVIRFQQEVKDGTRQMNNLVKQWYEEVREVSDEEENDEEVELVQSSRWLNLTRLSLYSVYFRWFKFCFCYTFLYFSCFFNIVIFRTIRRLTTDDRSMIFFWAFHHLFFHLYDTIWYCCISNCISKHSMWKICSHMYDFY